MFCQADGGIWETSVDSTTPKHSCSEACPGTKHRQKHPYRVIRGAKGDLTRRHLRVTQAELRCLGGSPEVEDHACSMRLQRWGEQNVAPGPYPAVAAVKNKVLLARSKPVPFTFSSAAVMMLPRQELFSQEISSIYCWLLVDKVC